MVSSISSGMGGMISSSISQMQERMFKKMDLKGDGKVDKDEMTAFQANGPQQGQPPGAPSIEELFPAGDPDGDGALTKLEMEAELSKFGQEMREEGIQSESDRSKKISGQMDADGDGKVTQEEMPQFQAKGPQGGPPPGGPPLTGSSSVEDMFSQLDSDQDGSHSESEFTSGMETLMAERLSSSTGAAATESTDDAVTSMNQHLSQAVNGCMKGYSSTFTTGTESGNLWSLNT